MNKIDKGVRRIKDPLGDYEYFDRRSTGDEIFNKKKNSSFIFWKIILPVIFLSLLGYRLFFLQVQEGFINLKLAEGNRIRNLPVSAPRGLIVDEKGELLVSNDSAYDLVTQIHKVKDLDILDQQVFGIIGVKKDDLIKIVKDNKSSLDLIVVKEKIPRDEALLLKSRLSTFGGFEIIPSYIRKYPDIAFSHILGYTGRANEQETKDSPVAVVNGSIGKSELEKTYDQYLQGKPGNRKAEVDASGRLVRLLSYSDPQSGDTLQTSINKKLQDYIYEILKKKTDEMQTKAAAVVMDPRDGTIKAMVSIPSYDNSLLASGISKEEYAKLSEDKNFPMLNRVVSGEYPSGSSIKPFIATSALEFGIVNPDTSFDTPPFIEIGQWKFPDWKDHGVTDIRRAIAESNNIFFFALGGGWGPIKNGLGPDGMKKGLEKFGFGTQTGVDLTGERDGFIPTPEWKKKTMKEDWYIGNTYNMAIGQGDLLVTPMQIANATSSIANGGKLFKPRFVNKVISPSGETIKEFSAGETTVNTQVFSGDNLKVVREGMRMTVAEGSAFSVFGSEFPISVAGKTGTAQFGPEVDGEQKTHAWFSSFAPYEDPKIVVTILVENGGEGYQTAAPIAKDIYSWWVDNETK